MLNLVKWPYIRYWFAVDRVPPTRAFTARKHGCERHSVSRSPRSVVRSAVKRVKEGSFLVIILYLLNGDAKDIRVFQMIACALIFEASTPFVSLRSILSNMEMKSSLLYLANGLLMVSVFFCCRCALASCLAPSTDLIFGQVLVGSEKMANYNTVCTWSSLNHHIANYLAPREGKGWGIEIEDFRWFLLGLPSS